jgi:hypothetical protein
MRLFAVLSLLFITSQLPGQESFNKYFTDKVLRFDFMLSGDSSALSYYPVRMRKNILSGSLNNCSIVQLRKFHI